MPLDWILSPLAQCAFLGAALIACLALFFSMKLEVAKVSRSVNDTRNAAAVTTAALAAELTTIRQELRDSGRLQLAAPETAIAAVTSELTPARRAQALRLQDRGETSAAIATTLRVPRNEIDLLIKVQKLVTSAQ